MVLTGYLLHYDTHDTHLRRLTIWSSSKGLTILTVAPNLLYRRTLYNSNPCRSTTSTMPSLKSKSGGRLRPPALLFDTFRGLVGTEHALKFLSRQSTRFGFITQLIHESRERS